MTDTNAHIENMTQSRLHRVPVGPPHDKTRKPGTKPRRDQPRRSFSASRNELPADPTTQAIYFQGATLDPLPVIQRLEDNLGVAVVLQQHRDDLEHPVETRREVFDQGLRQTTIGVAGSFHPQTKLGAEFKRTGRQIKVMNWEDIVHSDTIAKKVLEVWGFPKAGI